MMLAASRSAYAKDAGGGGEGIEIAPGMSTSKPRSTPGSRRTEPRRPSPTTARTRIRARRSSRGTNVQEPSPDCRRRGRSRGRRTSRGFAAGDASDLLPGCRGPWGRWAPPGWPSTRHTRWGRFEDVMVRGPLKSWRHRHLFSDTATGDTLIRDHVDYTNCRSACRMCRAAGGASIARKFRFPRRQLRDDLDFHARHREPKVIAVSGATGLVGRQLVALLGGGGHDVRRMVRESHWGQGHSLVSGRFRWTRPGSAPRRRHRRAPRGEPIGKRFTAHHKARVFDSRVRSTDLLARASRPFRRTGANARSWWPLRRATTAPIAAMRC